MEHTISILNHQKKRYFVISSLHINTKASFTCLYKLCKITTSHYGLNLPLQFTSPAAALHCTLCHPASATPASLLSFQCAMYYSLHLLFFLPKVLFLPGNFFCQIATCIIFSSLLNYLPERPAGSDHPI